MSVCDRGNGSSPLHSFLFHSHLPFLPFPCPAQGLLSDMSDEELAKHADALCSRKVRRGGKRDDWVEIVPPLKIFLPKGLSTQLSKKDYM